MWMAILKPKPQENTLKNFRKMQKKSQPTEN